MLRAKVAALAVAAAAMAVAGAIGTATGREALLDETAWLRQYYRLGPDRVSPAILRSEGEEILGAGGIRKLKDTTEAQMRRAGLDPDTLPWQDHVLVRLFFDVPGEYLYKVPPPPKDWTATDFDDHNWVLQRGPILAAPVSRGALPKGQGWTSADFDQADFSSLGVQSLHLRVRFVVADPAQIAGATLRLAFRGGARAWLNGLELARAYLPQGALASDAASDCYPKKAYLDQPEIRERSMGPVQIPNGRLRRGTNVLAVEVRAAPLHPLALSKKLPFQNHKVRQGMEGLWAHAQLTKLELAADSGPVVSALRRPAGPQVWVQDPHHRVESSEFQCGGEGRGIVRFVAVSNGTFAAQIVIAAGGQEPLTGLQLTCGRLQRADGPERLDASALQIFFPAPYPLAEFSEKALGDDRGLDATFPDNQLLAQRETLAELAQPCLFEHLARTAPAGIPAGACRPVWLSLRVPASAAPGTYQGNIQVKGDGLPLVELPVEAEVLDWQLPDPKEFQTFAGLEENPYGVAKQYAVQLWSDEHFKLLKPSFMQLARAGNRWLNVPVILHTEFGNRDDSMIRWTRRKDGTLTGDYAILDRYLDLAAQACGPPRVINFVVMQGMASAAVPPTPPAVNVLDEASGRTAPLVLGGPLLAGDEKRKTWGALARALGDHMRSRGQSDAMFWGYPLEQEADPELKLILEEFEPRVRWAANPHELLWNATYAKDGHYGAIVTVRYQPGVRSVQTFRNDRGWKSQLIHLLSPRTGGNVSALHTVSYPFAYRLLPEQALAHGYSGISRLGADEWAAIHYDGQERPKWLTGMPVLFMLWPGSQGAEPSIRFEELIEGLQETEARIFLERALESGRLPADLGSRVSRMLSGRLDETSFFPATLCVHAMERYHYRWQERSRELYQAAAEAARIVRK